jgi:acyl-CoA synthetase (AMP-forming)/AMP-acid ligase II
MRKLTLWPTLYSTNEVAASFRTAETFVDGWVRTGDEVIIKDHEVYVVDRLKVREISVLEPI